MKKVLAIAVLAIASVTASAQVFVGGSFNLERNVSKNQTNFTIAPEVGHNFNSKTALGGTLEFTHNYNNGLNTNIFSVNPYFRYKFVHAANGKLTIFVDTTVGLGVGNAKEGGEKSETATIWDAGFKPGIAYDISKHFTLVAHLGFIGYNGANNAAKLAGYDNKFGIDFSTNDLSFGISYNF